MRGRVVAAKQFEQSSRSSSRSGGVTSIHRFGTIPQFQHRSTSTALTSPLQVVRRRFDRKRGLVASAVVLALLDPLELSAHHVNGKLEPSQQSLPVVALWNLRTILCVGAYLPGFGCVPEQPDETAMNRGKLAGDLPQRARQLLELGERDRGGGRG
jgi:hypothetical protein